MSKAWSTGKGSDTRWQNFRLAIMDRDRWTCTIGDEGCTINAEHVDHIIPLSMGGDKYDPNNCRAACASCNLGRKKVSTQHEPPFKNVFSW